MAKEVVSKVKLQIQAGRATPAPPVGTVLGPAGINLQEFCTKFNDATKDKGGDVLPVEISIYEDRTFDFILKTPPTASLILKAAGIEKGSAKGANHVVATLTKDEIKKIAEIKMPDLNAYDIEAAMRSIEGTARNMGIAVKGLNDAELLEQEKEAEAAEAQAAKLEAELEEAEASAKAMAEGANVEVETTHQDKETEEETEEKENEE